MDPADYGGDAGGGGVLGPDGMPTVWAGPGDLRGRIAAAFDPDSLPSRLANDETTEITELTDQALGDWQIYDLLNLTRPHPLRVRIALSSDGLGRQLSGLPENYQMISSQVPVADADAALSRAIDFLDLTNPYSGLFYQVISSEDLRWVKNLDPDEQAIKDAFVTEYEPQLGPAVASEVSDGWQVASWWMYQNGLRHYTITVGADGSVTSDFEEVVGDLPTSIGT